MNKRIMMVAFTGMMLHCGTSFGMFTILDWFLEEKTSVKEVLQDGSGERYSSSIETLDEETSISLLESPPLRKKEVIPKGGETLEIKRKSGGTYRLEVEKTATILEVKKELYEAINKKEPSSLLDYQKIKLAFRGKFLKDKETLADYCGDRSFGSSSISYKIYLISM